ncbi:MAG: O-antigen ligase family protein [Rhizobiaceae bacterium]|nr:O-antigen ligase family protein [Rhizobiaceae bacterium]
MKLPTGLLADIPKVNRVFTLLCFASPPIIGSAVSFLFNGGGAVCAYNVARGRVKLSDIREIRLISFLFLAFVAVSVLAAFANGSALRKPTELLALVTFALFPVSYAYWSVSRKEEIMWSVVWGAAIGCMGGLAIAVVQMILVPDERPAGGAGNPLVFATVTVVAVSIVVVGILLSEQRKRGLLAAAALCGVVALILSQSRVPLMMLAVNALLLFVLFAPRGWLRRLWVPALALAALVGAMIATGAEVPLLSARFEEAASDWALIREKGDYLSSGGIRLAIWEIGFEMWKEAPWLGHGRGYAAEELGRRLVEQYDISRSFTHFHNFMLQALVQNGIIGFVSLLALLGYGFWLAIRTIRSADDKTRLFGAMMMLIVLVTYTGSGMTNIMFGHDILDAVFMVCMVPGVYLAVGREPRLTPPAAAP